MYDIQFYETAKGDCPFQTFLEGSDSRTKAKFIKLLDLLEEHGPNLKRPYADSLRDGIRELRVRISTNRYRALYFFMVDGRIVITHGLLKKSDEVPKKEIDRAIKYKNDFEAREMVRVLRPD